MFTKIDNMGNKIKLIKGAPEVIINASNSYYDEFGIKKNISDKNKILSKVKELSGSKLRLIAIAISDDIFVTDNLKNITLLGFIVLADSIRENVLEGINLVNSASIQTIMITGDNKETAVSIARELNLIERLVKAGVIDDPTETNNIEDNAISNTVENNISENLTTNQTAQQFNEIT